MKADVPSCVNILHPLCIHHKLHLLSKISQTLLTARLLNQLWPQEGPPENGAESEPLGQFLISGNEAASEFLDLISANTLALTAATKKGPMQKFYPW